MNMKKKSLVASLLAVSIIAQPAAALANEGVSAETTDTTQAAVKNITTELSGKIESIVEAYKEDGLDAVIKLEVEGKLVIDDTIEKIGKLTATQVKLIELELDKNETRGYYSLYEAIVKEYKESQLTADEAEKAAAEVAEKLLEAAGLKLVDVKGKKVIEAAKDFKLTVENANKVYSILKEETSNTKDKVFKFTGFNKEGKATFGEDSNLGLYINEEKGKDPNNYIKVIQDDIIAKDAKLGTIGTLETSYQAIEDYIKEVKELNNYGKDIYTLDMAKKIAGQEEEHKGSKTRIEAILGLYKDTIANDLSKAVDKGSIEAGKDKITSLEKITLTELEKAYESFDNLPEYIKASIDDNKGTPVGFYNENGELNEKDVRLNFTTLTGDDIPANERLVRLAIEELNARVEEFEKDVKELAAQEKPGKAQAIALLNKLNDDKELGLAKDHVAEDVIKLLEDIIADKPVAPVKETYYSLGVNVRDAEENLLGRLDRGFVIENAVKKGNYVHFTYEGKEAKAHINFVSKEKPLDAFYSKGGNVRETPDTKGLKLGYLPVNQIVLGEVTEDGVWVEIEFNGRKAFIANNRLSKEAVEVRYTSVGANVRNAAGEKVGYYKAGEVFKGVKEGNRIKVDYKGAVGYVHVAFVK